MGSFAQATAQVVVAERPVAIIVAPPWLRTGSGRVFEDQVAYYRDRGFATAFVAVPVNPAHVPQDPMWRELTEAGRELGADHVSFAVLDPAPSAYALRRRARRIFRTPTALDWIVEVAACSRPAPALLNFLRGRNIALTHVNHVFTLGFARRLRRQLGRAGRAAAFLVETHDVQSLLLKDRCERNPWTGRTDDLQALLRSECALLGAADVLVHCSVDDQQFFSKRFPQKPHALARPRIEAAFIAAVAKAGPPQLPPIDVLIVATGYDANVEAVEWFLTKVWPLLADRGLVLRIVGRVSDLVRERLPKLYDQFRDCFVGPVADLVPYYRAASCVAAPMRSGGGISIKTVEACALGMPFVGTSKAFRGLPSEALARLGVRGYDDPRAFADALLQAVSPEDATAAAGRAFYEELFSKNACYGARDEAIRTALAIHGRPFAFPSAPERRASSCVSDGAPDFLTLILGTSNSVGPNSFIQKGVAASGLQADNLSIGACSSSLCLYQLATVRPVNGGAAFLDFAINDNDAAINLWGRASARRIIAANIKTAAAQLRSMHYLPVLLIGASDPDQDVEPVGYALHREICHDEQINFLDLRRLVLGIIEGGVPRDALMRDHCHLSDRAGDAVAEFVASLVRRTAATRPTLAQRTTAILPSRVVYANQLFPQARIMDRGSSLRSAPCGRLLMGDVIGVPSRHNERLVAMMINLGAKGGTVVLRNGDVHIIKPLTAYWSAEQPDSYAAMLVDLAQPMSHGPRGITVEMAGIDAVATEPTLHAKPTLAGRYGEVEIEGVLLAETSEVRFDYASPCYGWMPLDLSELPEARKLSDRLASL